MVHFKACALLPWRARPAPGLPQGSWRGGQGMTQPEIFKTPFCTPVTHPDPPSPYSPPRSLLELWLRRLLPRSAGRVPPLSCAVISPCDRHPPKHAATCFPRTSGPGRARLRLPLDLLGTPLPHGVASDTGNVLSRGVRAMPPAAASDGGAPFPACCLPAAPVSLPLPSHEALGRGPPSCSVTPPPLLSPSTVPLRSRADRKL